MVHDNTGQRYMALGATKVLVVKYNNGSEEWPSETARARHARAKKEVEGALRVEVSVRVRSALVARGGSGSDKIS